MKAFRFALEPVLSYRRQVEEAKKRAFALARRAAQEHHHALQRLFAEESSAKEDLRRMESSLLDLSEVLAQRRYLTAIARRIAQGREQLQKRTQEQAAARAAYIGASRDRRVLERLRERRWEEYRVRSDREEQKDLDEVAGRMRRPRMAGGA